MNAIDLLPPDLRRGAGAPTRSGGGVYVLLGVLALAVVLASTAALANRRVEDRRVAVATAQQEAQDAQTRAATLSRFKQLAADTGARVGGVRQVAARRVDWSRALDRISQAIGTDVAFTSLEASTTPGADGTAPAGSAAATGTGPSVEVVGCARDHAAVARLIARFRAMDFVDKVSLASAETKVAAMPPDACAQGGLRSQFSASIHLIQPTGAGATATASTPGAPK